MTAETELIDAAARHQVHLLRYGSGIVGRILKLLESVDGRLVEQIAAKLAKLRANDRGEVTQPNWTTKRLQALLEDIQALTTLSSQTLSGALEAELLAFVEYEAAFQADLIPKTFDVQLELVMPAPQQLYAAVIAKPLMGKHLRDILRELNGQVRVQIMQALREGYVLGETIDQISRRVDTDALGWKRRHVEGLVRTATNHTATVAREKLYAENSSLFSGIRWVSTLDHRTTEVCRARDGQVYPVDSGPRPPAHFNCRSTTAPVVKSWRDLGIDEDEAPEGDRPAVVPKDLKAGGRRRTRDLDVSQVSASETYNTWLRRQPRAFVDDVLGKKKARLYMEGKLTLDRFVDHSGKSYTLAELRRREGAAFSRAGL
jgi:SPP1 gp7 family putative phage head morphogenesis protein